MKNWSIQNRVLFLALLPGIMVSVVLGVYFISGRSSDLSDLLSQRALAMAKQLAPTCEYGVMTGSIGILQNIANSMLEENDVRSVNLYDQEMNVIAHAGPRMITESIGTTQVRENQLQLVHTQGSVRVKAPIFAQNLIIPDQLSNQFYDSPPPKTEPKLLGWAEIELSNTNTRLARYQHVATSFSIIFIVLVLCGVLALRISRKVSEPVHDILAALNEVRDGKLDTRVHVQEGAELKELASGVNAMAAAIQRANIEYQQTIEQASRENQETIDELEIRNHELALGRKQALEASRMKSDFLANVSHEIRTPLNGIIGFSDLLARTQTSERQNDYLQTIHKSSEDLLNIINDILDLSKIDAGKLIIDSAPFNLRDVVEESIQVLAPEAATRDIALVQYLSTELPATICGDRLRLKQILTNLINNAVKFTPEGSVTVRAYPIRQDNSRISIQFDVIDTGIGLSDDQRSRLFQAFSQADASIARQYGGTGLGLIISKALVEAMNGDIRVESTEGDGSTFSFTIEAAIDQEAAAPIRAFSGLSIAIIEEQPDWAADTGGLLEYWGANVSIHNTPNSFFNGIVSDNTTKPDCLLLSADRNMLKQTSMREWFNLCEQYQIPLIPIIYNGKADDEDELPESFCSLTLSRPFTQKKLQAHIKTAIGLIADEQINASEIALQAPPKVLAVDDNEANLKLIVTLLNELGATVISATSGFEAVAIAEREMLDLILMDIQMPGMSGTEATQRIRELPGKTTLPIVAITAHAMADERQSLIKAGLNDYQTKPISQEQLARTLEHWTGYIPQAQQTQIVMALGVNQCDEDNQTIFSADIALRHANQNTGLALDMFQMLINNINAEKEKIVFFWESESLDELLEVIHRLHGATRYCGIPALRCALDHFETQLKANNIGEFPTAMRNLIEQIDKLITWEKENNWKAIIQAASMEKA